jgi:hypothetical protein
MAEGAAFSVALVAETHIHTHTIDAAGVQQFVKRDAGAIAVRVHIGQQSHQFCPVTFRAAGRTNMADSDDDALSPAPIARLDLLPARDGVMLTYAKAPAAVCIKSTAVVESDIAVLGLARTRLLPAVPESWPGGRVAGCYRDPAYSIEHDALAGDVLIHLRDERFGWLHYIVTRDRALDFANRILAQLDAPPPPMAGQA